MKVLHLLMMFSSIGDVMIRDDYGEAMRDIEGHSASKKKSVIIAGHPGIGKNMGLRLASMCTHIYSPFSRQDYVIVLHFGQNIFSSKSQQSFRTALNASFFLMMTKHSCLDEFG